jgi:hypothetical protein
MNQDQTIKYAFRLVHISNIPHILEHGFVHPDSPQADPQYVRIGDKDVISVRTQKTICNGISLDSYIPFYFGPRSPMLYVIQHGYNNVKQYHAEELVYCVGKIEELIQGGIQCVFTDGHALSAISTLYSQNELRRIDEIIAYKDVYAGNWVCEEDRDLKRRKEAELLSQDELPPRFICGFVVYNQKAKDLLGSYGVLAQQIAVRPGYYFDI